MQFIRFLAVGVLNTAIGLACIYLAMWALGMDYRLANAVGYAIGCIVGFLLNRSWTFRYEGGWLGSLLRWAGVVGVSYALNLLTVIALHDRLAINGYVAQLGGVIVYSIAGYLGGRYFAFRSPALAGLRT